jgi:CheY-like chemotaxis protein
LARERILIVEDEGIVVLHIKKTLERLGYVVAGIAASGADAIAKTTTLKPDLVLIDIVLKGSGDGIDAAEEIRTITNVPLIYLTAHADESTLKRAKVTEPFGYIVKPFRERDLYIAIEFALYKAEAEAEKMRLGRQLAAALADVRAVRGLLPLCVSCKKIRDRHGNWIELEKYVAETCDRKITHGVCPACSEKP